MTTSRERRGCVLGLLLLAAQLGCHASSTAPPRDEPAAGEQEPHPYPDLPLVVTFAHEDTSRRARVVVFAKADQPELALHVARRTALRGRDVSRVQVTTARHEISGAGRTALHFDLAGLDPGAEYTLTLWRGKERASAPRYLRTLPLHGPIIAGFGGDLYSSPITESLLGVVAREKADVLVLGGDLAYANGNPAAVALWDRLLSQMDHQLVRKDGTLIPIIAAIGNHEVNPLALGRPTRGDMPFYDAIFASRPAATGEGATHFTRLLSDHTVLLVLDSGHFVTHDEQVPFLSAALTRHAARPVKLATYHVPLWPSHRSVGGPLSVAGRTAWMPLFDQHALTVAFEHHDHTLKRTKRLRARLPDENGTLYVGDGCMGNSERQPDPTRPYLERTSASFHVWIANLSTNGVKLRALSPTGEELDRAEVTTPKRMRRAP